MIRGTNRTLAALLLTSLMLICSCTSNIVYTGSESMKDNIWILQNVPSFDILISDTINSNNVLFTLRTGSSYPFRNIYLFVTTTSPDGQSLTDTLQYNLADEKGNWFGKGFGDIHELDLKYKSNVYFPVKGNYRFSIRHGMRIEDLEGVYDFGIRIEKYSK
jgi:gliding motility-associated lipoprotein GldH